MQGKRGRAYSTILPLIPILLLILLPAVAPSHYYIVLSSIALCYAVYSLSWNILASTGQVSLGHGAFLGLGAYISTVVSNLYGINVWASIFIGPILPTILALGIGLICLRLREWFLSIATFAFVPILQYTISSDQLRWLFRGWDGLYAVTLFSPSDINYRIWSYYAILGFMLASLFLTHRLFKSRVKLAFFAIHDSEVVAETLGISALKYKLLSFVMSAYLAGIAGALLIHGVYRYVTPDIFMLIYSIYPILFTMLGGVKTVSGPVVGSFVGFFLLEMLLRIIGGFISFVIIGIILIVIVILMPSGISPMISHKLAALRRPSV